MNPYNPNNLTIDDFKTEVGLEVKGGFEKFDRLPNPKEYKNNIWSRESIDDTLNRIDSKKSFGIYTNHKAHKLFIDAFSSINLKGKTLAVIGSRFHWIECCAIYYGCENIITVEYNPPVSEHPFIKTISYNDFIQSEFKYDIICSYSSIEHSGLGRYGDPLEVNADLKSMSEMKDALIDGGYLILGVPCVEDQKGITIFPMHRVYGHERLGLLERGLNKEKTICKTEYFRGYQPIHIYKK